MGLRPKSVQFEARFFPWIKLRRKCDCSMQIIGVKGQGAEGVGIRCTDRQTDMARQRGARSPRVCQEEAGMLGTQVTGDFRESKGPVCLGTTRG